MAGYLVEASKHGQFGQGYRSAEMGNQTGELVIWLNKIKFCSFSKSRGWM
jgi:hypothetical protein